MTDAAEPTPRLTVAVATRNRPDVLADCLESLRALAPLPVEVLVVDDASEPSIVPAVEARFGAGTGFPHLVRVRRHERNAGYIPTRNAMAREASAPFVLSLDDDARLLDPAAVVGALEAIEADDRLGAVALAQAGDDGRPLPAFMQPAPVDYPCFAPAFMGYGHVLRRDLFLKLGGYRERFGYYGEESEYAKRMLDAGYRTLYLPGALVVHSHSAAGRDERKRLRLGYRNACLDAMYNEPLPRLALSLPARLANYLRWRRVPSRHYGFSDRGGFRWLLRELAGHAPAVWRERRPLKWSTYREWRRLKTWPPYDRALPVSLPAAAGSGRS